MPTRTRPTYYTISPTTVLGIPEEIQESLFEVFVTKGKEKGTGLGMSTVKNIVEAHGGEISFETKLGEGTKFTVRVCRWKNPTKP